MQGFEGDVLTMAAFFCGFETLGFQDQSSVLLDDFRVCRFFVHAHSSLKNTL
jgi:hypothetical protein